MKKVENLKEISGGSGLSSSEAKSLVDKQVLYIKKDDKLLAKCEFTGKIIDPSLFLPLRPQVKITELYDSGPTLRSLYLENEKPSYLLGQPYPKVGDVIDISRDYLSYTK